MRWKSWGASHERALRRITEYVFMVASMQISTFFRTRSAAHVFFLIDAFSRDRLTSLHSQLDAHFSLMWSRASRRCCWDVSLVAVSIFIRNARLASLYCGSSSPESPSAQDAYLVLWSATANRLEATCRVSSCNNLSASAFLLRFCAGASSVELSVSMPRFLGLTR